MKQLRVTDEDGMVWLVPFNAARIGEPGVEVVTDDPPAPPPIVAPPPAHPVASFRQHPTTVREGVESDAVAVRDDIRIKVTRPKRYHAKGWKE